MFTGCGGVSALAGVFGFGLMVVGDRAELVSCPAPVCVSLGAGSYLLVLLVAKNLAAGGGAYLAYTSVDTVDGGRVPVLWPCRAHRVGPELLSVSPAAN